MGVIHWIGVVLLVGSVVVAAGYLLFSRRKAPSSKPLTADAKLADATMRLQRMVGDADALAEHLGENAGNAVKSEAIALFSAIVLKPTKPTE